jgi:hypothetical protein
VSWPARDAICPACRQVVAAGASCPAGHGVVHALAEPGVREQLVTEVWGPKPSRTRAIRAAKAGVAGGGATTFNGCGDWIPDGLPIVALVVVLAFVVLWLLVRQMVDRARRRRGLLAANGARRPRLALGAGTGRYGTIVAGTAAKPPIEGRRCVAYALTLQHRGATMLYDGAIAGFEIALDSGERLRVPAGPCAIDLADAPRAGGVHGYLARLDPTRRRDEPFDPFVHDDARARVLTFGDRVEVLGPLLAVADGAGARGAAYRDASAQVLEPAGVPALRVIEGTRRSLPTH